MVCVGWPCCLPSLGPGPRCSATSTASPSLLSSGKPITALARAYSLGHREWSEVCTLYGPICRCQTLHLLLGCPHIWPGAGWWERRGEARAAIYGPGTYLYAP